MTSVNAERRRVMARARGLARSAALLPKPGLIRGDLLPIPYEDLLDMVIELLRVCPVEAMTVPEIDDMIPCDGCGTAITTDKRRRYCSTACRKTTEYQRRPA